MRKFLYTLRALFLLLEAGQLQTSKLVKIIMKTIAILALTAAALVSCQQQQQQPAPEPTPAPVAPVCKGK